MNNSSTQLQFTAHLIALCAQVENVDLQAVHQARDCVAEHLKACSAPPAWSQLIRGDIAETLLSRVQVVIQQASQYQSNPQEQFRSRFMAIHLEAALCHWLMDRAAGKEELSILENTTRRVLAAARA